MTSKEKAYQIWCAINPILIQVFIMNVSYGVFFGIYAAYTVTDALPLFNLERSLGRVGLLLLDPDLLFFLISNIICTVYFLPIWIATKKSNPVYHNTNSIAKTAIIVALSFIGLNLLQAHIHIVSRLGNILAYQEVSEPNYSGNPVVSFLYLVLAAPIVEEICYRGIVTNRLLMCTKPWVTVFIQAILFGFMHLNYFQGIVAFFSGLCLGLLYLRFRKLLLCVVGHSAFNFLYFYVRVLHQSNSADISEYTPEMITQVSFWYMFVPGVILCVIGMLLLSKQPAAVLVEASPVGHQDSYAHELPV